jgi:hypothetical protein
MVDTGVAADSFRGRAPGGSVLLLCAADEHEAGAAINLVAAARR